MSNTKTASVSTTEESRSPVMGAQPLNATPYAYGVQGCSDGFHIGSGGPDNAYLLRIARRKWPTIVLTLIFALSAAGFYLSKATPIYKAVALIELSARRPRILNQQAAVIEDPSVSSQFEQTLNTQLEKLRKSDMIPSVLACYRHRNGDDRTPDDALAQRLRQGVSFDLLRRTRLVEVSFLDSDPTFAAQACQAFAEGAEVHARLENRDASDAAVGWLEAQAKTQRQELERADQALFDARQVSRMDVLEGRRKTAQEALLSFSGALVDVETQAAREREMLAALTAMDLTVENVRKLPATVPRAQDVASAVDRWESAVAERDAMLSKYTTEHPGVQARTQAAAIHHKQALVAMEGARTTTAANLALLDRQAAGIRQMQDEQSDLAADMERDILDRQMKLSALERARDAADASYRGILNRIQEARMSADENTATVKLVEGASMPQRPVRPRPVWILALAAMLGMAAGIVLALVVGTLEGRVVTARDVEVDAGIRIIAVIPHAATRARQEIATASLSRRFSEVVEAFAGLRMVLDSQGSREQAKVVLVASSLPEEGKTVTSCNLAVTCARGGQRVLLIDSDLRRPRIADIFSIPAGRRNLSEYLEGADVDLTDLVYTDGCPNLGIVAAGSLRKALPADVAGGARMSELIAWARAEFDRVILDAPPLGLVGDALALAGFSDCVLLAARPAVSRKRAICHTVQRLRDAGVDRVAAVINDVDVARFSAFAYGLYHYYYKHYRSYSSSERNTQ